MTTSPNRRKQSIFLILGWALFLFAWAMLGYLDRSHSGIDTLAELYWVFLVYGGPGLVFPLLLLPLFKGKLPHFFAYLVLSVLTYLLAYYITASGARDGWPMVTGGGVGALGIGLLHYFLLIRKGRAWVMPVVILLGCLSFVPGVAIDPDYLFTVSIPLWVVTVGICVVMGTPVGGERGKA